MKLSDQEVRICVNFGPFYELLKQLNEVPSWRNIYGPKSERLKDHELILRFLAILHDVEKYESPMKTFLNNFMKANNSERQLVEKCFREEFTATITEAERIFGEKAFRPERQINAAVFDAIMVALSRRMAKGPITDVDGIKQRYETLLGDSDFQRAYIKATANTENVQLRVLTATNAFADVR